MLRPSFICHDPFFDAVDVGPMNFAVQRRECAALLRDCQMTVSFACQPLQLRLGLDLNSPDAIERALGASGFRMSRIDFRSFEHDPFGWVQSTLDRLGFEQSLLVKVLARMSDRRSGFLLTVAAMLLAIPLGAIGLVLALASWRAGAGAVMEVWATRDERPAG